MVASGPEDPLRGATNSRSPKHLDDGDLTSGLREKLDSEREGQHPVNFLFTEQQHEQPIEAEGDA